MMSENNLNDKKDWGQKETSEMEYLLTLIGQPDITEKAEQSREKVFNDINSRITKSNRKDSKSFPKVILWWSVAASIIISTSIGFFFYHIGFRSGLDKLAVTPIEIESPVNSILKIMLPDSSSVILNSGSTLCYPSFFSGKERTVRLEGEAYFHIQKDEDKLFVVETPDMNVYVLGTKFNLKHSPEESYIWVTLEEGSVMAKSNLPDSQEIILSPNEQAILNKENGEISVQKVYPGLYTYWLSGSLFFRDNTLEEIASVLEKRFSTEIIIENEALKKETFYCQFGKDDNLERILHLLSNKGNWLYTISDNKVVIKNK